MNKVFESEHLIRFQDCDPFNHLNNARYIDYFMNAREDHLEKYLNFRIYEEAAKTGRSWVVTQNQIAYFRPANLMEKVVIDSTLVQLGKKHIVVELNMWNADKSQRKSILWVRFTHYDLSLQKSAEHSETLNRQFSPYVNNEITASNFEDRLKELAR